MHALQPLCFCAICGIFSSQFSGAEGSSCKAGKLPLPCPSCGVVPGRVHSRYPRRLAFAHRRRRAVLMLCARRFRCEAVLCGRRILTERFDETFSNRAQRTARLVGSSIASRSCRRPTGGEFRAPLERASSISAGQPRPRGKIRGTQRQRPGAPVLKPVEDRGDDVENRPRDRRILIIPADVEDLL